MQSDVQENLLDQETEHKPLITQPIFSPLEEKEIKQRVYYALKVDNEIVDITYFNDLLTGEELRKLGDPKNKIDAIKYLNDILLELMGHFESQTDEKSQRALAYAYYSLAELYYNNNNYAEFFESKIKFSKIKYSNQDIDRKYNKIKINFAVLSGKISLKKNLYEQAFKYYKEAYEIASNVVENERFTTSYQTQQQIAENGMRVSLLKVMKDNPNHELGDLAENVSLALTKNTINGASLVPDSIYNTIMPIVDKPIGIQILGILFFPITVPVLISASVVGLVNGVRNVLSRSPLDKNAQNMLIQKLWSTKDDARKAIIDAVVNQYNQLPPSIFRSKSKSSEALLATLMGTSELNKKWAALYNYVVKKHDDKNCMKNNGKALFGIIDTVINTQQKVKGKTRAEFDVLSPTSTVHETKNPILTKTM
jgi:tetratricopeptide (TPR) repeat protein